jgi:nucleotide-binding universal stress UspA family protein
MPLDPAAFRAPRRAAEELAHMDTIVVGVDGSGGSKAALRWAYAAAARRGAKVRAVSVWQYPYLAVAPAPLGGAVAPAPEMQAASEEALESVLADVGLPDDVEVERVVKEGSASHVLLDEAADASMIVVGARGHGGFAGLLLGSVATQCVNHARIATVVVPVD